MALRNVGTLARPPRKANASFGRDDKATETVGTMTGSVSGCCFLGIVFLRFLGCSSSNFSSRRMVAVMGGGADLLVSPNFRFVMAFALLVAVAREGLSPSVIL